VFTRRGEGANERAIVRACVRAVQWSAGKTNMSYTKDGGWSGNRRVARGWRTKVGQTARGR
jgi:hypothetical protein